MSDDRKPDPTTIRREPPSTRAPEPSLLLYHRDGVKVVSLRPGASVVVGRTYPSDAVVDDRSLSRQHARFSADVGGVTLEDLESTNGTWVNGERVTKARVSYGDVIRIGDVAASLHVVPARGVDGHDRFMSALEDEVKRAHTFARPVAVVMLSGEHVSKWTARVASALRPADRIGIYADDTALVMLPELGREAASVRAKELGELAGSKKIGLAVLPDDAASGEELLSAVRASHKRGWSATTSAPPGFSASTTPPNMVVRSERMRAVLDEVARVAPSTLPVLVHGETGTGKELIARAIHDQSPRRGGPMRSINCGAIPSTLVEGMLFGHERGAFTSADKQQKGIFEQAHGGTVFLDEIGELPLTAQAALLRVLETKKLTRIGGDREIEVDVRVVAATHRDLEAMCDAGAFRRDLVYRLNAVVLDLPPLRERVEEIEPLVSALLAEASASAGRAVRGLSPEALELVRRYPWPGNVRELKNAIERAVVIARGELVIEADLPARVRETAPRSPSGAPEDARELGDFKERVKQQTQKLETEMIVEALRRTNGNQTEAAKLLNMPVRTFTHKMRELGIKKTFG
ncbi:MAG TPA: sigma 54-interacting transcriptional regulator [Polyangiaceae bacterium]|nr:sigma 54-interacting transcriptional regulator [Polyangiaceae bacterium]